MQQKFWKGTLEKEVKKLTHYEKEHWLKLTIQIGADFVKKMQIPEVNQEKVHKLVSFWISPVFPRPVINSTYL